MIIDRIALCYPIYTKPWYQWFTGTGSGQTTLNIAFTDTLYSGVACECAPYGWQTVTTSWGIQLSSTQPPGYEPNESYVYIRGGAVVSGGSINYSDSGWWRSVILIGW